MSKNYRKMLGLWTHWDRFFSPTRIWRWDTNQNFDLEKEKWFEIIPGSPVEEELSLSESEELCNSRPEGIKQEFIKMKRKNETVLLRQNINEFRSSSKIYQLKNS